MFLDNYYYYFQKALTPEFCDKIIETGKSKIIEKAKTHDESLKARNSSIAWMEEDWLYQNIEPFIQEANKQAGWNFDWVGSEKCQFTIYKENQFYHWHQDSHNKMIDGNIRKLSVTVSLEDGNNYEGGDLEFDLRNREDSESVILSAKDRDWET